MNKGHQRITLRDVAREAGVSPATVGFVLSNDPHQTISPATQEKVRQAARRLGYQSFAPVRLLRTGRSSIVLLVIQTIHIAPIYAYVVEPLAKALSAYGFNLLWQIGISPDPLQPHPASDLVPAVVVSLIEEPDRTSEEFLQRFGAPIGPGHLRCFQAPTGDGAAPGNVSARQGAPATCVFQRAGYADLVLRIQDLWLQGQRKAAIALVPDDLILKTNLIGTKERVRERLRLYQRAGVTTLNVGAAGQTLDERLNTLGQLIDLLNEV